MKIPIPVLGNHRREHERHPECDGFFGGANGTQLQEGIVEIESRHNRQKAELEQKVMSKIKQLESVVHHAESFLPEIEEAWQQQHEKHSDDKPHIIFPTVLITVGVYILYAESRLLAPGMDIFSVSDPDAQLATAAGTTLVAALAFHWALMSTKENRMKPGMKLTSWLTAIIMAIGLSVWGVLRGLEVGFGADQTHNPLGDFLRGHPILSSIFYVLITLATPFIAAVAAHYGVGEIEEWWAYQGAKRQHRKLKKVFSKATKQMEAEKESLRLNLKALDESAKEQKALFAQSHKRGQNNGTRQEQYWTVPFKATIAALIASILFGWPMIVLSPFFGAGPIAVWMMAFYYYRRQWMSPNPVEFYELEKVQFVVKASDAGDSENPTTPILVGKGTFKVLPEDSQSNEKKEARGI